MSEVVIIGAGLGGLLCGAYLSRRGFGITVLEQGLQTGGCLQTFVREGERFDTGFHSVGGLAPGEPLYCIFEPLGLMSLPWEKVPDDEGFPFLRLQHPTEGVSAMEREHILEPYKGSSWRLRGGGKVLADALQADILAHGGRVLTRRRVVRIASGTAYCSDSSSYSGIIIADIHPLSCMAICTDHIRPSYLRRLRSYRNGDGVFSVYIKLAKGIPSDGHGIFADGSLMIHFGDAGADGLSHNLTLLCFAPARPFDRNELAISCIAKARQQLPELEPASWWTSTPATWERYTLTPGGSAYGFIKDYDNPSLSFLPPETPVPGLFLTGQNLGLHGVLGVSKTALRTCHSVIEYSKSL